MNGVNRHRAVVVHTRVKGWGEWTKTLTMTREYAMLAVNWKGAFCRREIFPLSSFIIFAFV